jgi:hypothetical protein
VGLDARLPEMLISKETIGEGVPIGADRPERPSDRTGSSDDFTGVAA